ncbi:MAG TPA: mercury resistance system transport protein MerF [Nitrospiraceae bacterium]|nr:mercury resistance system transport protein MerF [Nitrospiraceae bacterium]
MNEAKPTAQEPTSAAKHSRKLVITGMVGAGIVALCCVTPILVGLLAVLGLGALTGYLDLVLLPALAFFIGLLMYGLVRQRSREASCCPEPPLSQGDKDEQNRHG